MRENLVKELISEKVGAEAYEITTLVGGQVGHVYRVDTTDKSYVVKLVEAWHEPSFSEEERDDRVYGSRWSNLLPAYELLQKRGIAVPKLYVSGLLESEKLNYEILDYLHGDSEDYSTEWFVAVGNALGSIHKVTRAYQGWIGMEASYSESWSDAFTKSLESQLEQAKPYLSTELCAQVIECVAQHKSITEPEAFVLSHTDGFQGVLKKDGSSWELIGVVDIEDYQFADQGFVLAGFELVHATEKRTVPNEFWTTYSQQTAIDPTFDTYKKLFQIYYLLVWSRVLKDQPEPFKKCIDMLSELVV